MLAVVLRPHTERDGCPFDPTIRPQTIGELAKWTITERDRGGLRRERFQSWAETFPVPSRTGAERSSGIPAPA